MAPILCFAGATIYHDEGIYYYGFQDFLFVLGYGAISYTGLAFVTFFVWIIIYLQISIYITKRSEYQKNKAKKSLARMTAASFLFTFGK
uniref:Uncharacterized protein n=1 Tax=Panagrolaimus superbus TaxID=310955 RepID=A0A914Z5A1_9BILA